MAKRTRPPPREKHWLLQEAEWALMDTVLAFRSAAEDVRAGKFGEVKNVNATVGDLSRASTRMTTEITKHERDVLEQEGLLRDAAIDFDAVRDEIGRALDRIRAAEGSD